jgi:hypothetical protein
MKATMRNTEMLAKRLAGMSHVQVNDIIPARKLVTMTRTKKSQRQID